MPQLQVVDLSPTPAQPTQLDKTLDEFRTRIADQKDRDVLRDVYEKYKREGSQLDDAIMDLQTRPGLSPTRRVEAANQLLQLKKTNTQLQKNTLKQQEVAAKEESRIETKNALINYGATPEEAELYVNLSTGGQTQAAKNIIDTVQRRKPNALGSSPQNMSAARQQVQQPAQQTSQVTQTQGQQQVAPQQTVQQQDLQPTQIGTVDNDYNFDPDAGLTPSERVKRQESRFKVQTPLVNKNSEQVKGLDSEARSISLLNELNKTGNVGTGLSKLNVNPKTGDLLIPQFASAEEQLFVKTVNDFTVKAKDSFGARVSNFELDRFMQRLPTLANSVEGRELILRQMGLVNKILKLEAKEIQNVFDERGIRNIDYADAEKIARNRVKPEKDKLEAELLDLESLSKKETEAVIQQYKSKVQPGYVLLRTPGGQMKQFPEKNLEILKDKGYVQL